MAIIGHGIDITDIARIDAMLDEHGERFCARCFTEEERAYAESGPRHRAGAATHARIAPHPVGVEWNPRAGINLGTWSYANWSRVELFTRV